LAATFSAYYRLDQTFCNITTAINTYINCKFKYLHKKINPSELSFSVAVVFSCP